MDGNNRSRGVSSSALLAGNRLLNFWWPVLVWAAFGCGGASSRTPDAGVEAGVDTGSPSRDAATDSGSDGEVRPADYERLFPTDRVVDVDLTFDEGAWETLMQDPMVDVYVPARLTFDGIVVEDVGVRLKGNSSRNAIQRQGSVRYSFKVDIDKYVDGQVLLGIDKLNLNNGFKDPSYLRERLGADLHRALGIPTPRVAFARLSRNGEYFGLYNVVEQVDREFLREHFEDDSGDLFKPDRRDGTLVWRGDSLSNYPDLGLETNEDSPTHDGIIELLDVLNHTPPEEFESAISEVLDVDLCLRWLAATVALVNLDSYVGMAHNYYLYEDRSEERFVLIPWDMNESFGNFDCMMPAQELIELPYTEPICGPPEERPLVVKVLESPTYRAQLEEHLEEVVGELWTPALVSETVENLAAMIRQDVQTDPTAFFPVRDFEANLHDDQQRGPHTTFGLTSFAERRVAAVRSQLP